MSVFDEPHVTLAHGNGGRFMAELIAGIITEHGVISPVNKQNIAKVLASDK